MEKQPALFLDRDGVINYDHQYVYQISDFEFIPGIFELVKAANQHNYPVFIVTNQSGIARGYYTSQDYYNLMTWVLDQFQQHGCSITHVYHSPYHPEVTDKYQQYEFLRKPWPGMMFKASWDYDIDLRQSIMVGDKDTDMIAAKRANIPTRLLLGSETSKSATDIISSPLDVIKYLK